MKRKSIISNVLSFLIEGTPKGDCFEAAVKYILYTDDSAELVHGYVTGTAGDSLGKRFAHAWNEKGNTVIDTSNKRNIRMPKAAYYAIGDINPNKVIRYNGEAAILRLVKEGNYGPWDLTRRDM